MGKIGKNYAIIFPLMQEGIKDRFLRGFTWVLVVSIFVGGLLFAWPTYLRSKALQRQEADLDRRIAEKRAEIARLVECQKRFRTDRDFVEMIARQKNRRVYPGELVFIFEEDAK